MKFRHRARRRRVPPRSRRAAAGVTAVAAVLCGLLLGFTGIPARAAPALPPERLPSDHWTIPDIEELATAGGLDSLWIYTRPLTRPEVAAALVRAAKSSVTDPRLARLLRQFGLEAAELDSSVVPRPPKPLYRSSGDGAELRVWPALRAGVSRERGDKWRAGPLTQFGGQGGFYVNPHTLFYAEIVAREYPGSSAYAEPIFHNTEITTLAERFYISAGWPLVRVALGRDRARWGEGQSGSLVLGDAAPAANFLDFSVAWRRLHATVLTQQLDAYLGEYLSGHRLEWRATRGLMLAFSEVARYHSGSPDLIYLTGLTPYTIVQRLNDADAVADPGNPAAAQRNNIMAYFETAWRPRPGLTLAGGLLVDEKSLGDSIPARLGGQVNVLWTQVHAARPWTLRAEYTRIDNYVYAVSYGENYIFHGVSTAYPTGPDVRRVTARLSRDLGRDFEAWLSADRMDKGAGLLGDSIDSLGIFNAVPPQSPPSQLQDVVQHSLELRVGGRYLFREDLRAEAEIGWAHASNAGHVQGQTQDQLVGRLALEWRR